MFSIKSVQNTSQQEKISLNEKINLKESMFTTQPISQIEQLKQTVDQALEQIKNRSYIVDEPTSNLDLLIERYQLEQSIIGSVACWYGGSFLWKKIALGILIGAISIGIGFLCHAPVVISIVGAVCYLIFALLSINHYNITQKQIKLLSEDIIELEKSVSETTQLFNEFSEKLHIIYLHAYELSAHFESDVEQMRTKVNTLTSQLSEYKKIVDSLSASEKNITTSSSHLTQTIKQCTTEFDSNCKYFSQKNTELSAVNDHLSQISHSLKNSVGNLSIIKFNPPNPTEYNMMSESAKKMQQLVEQLKSHPNLTNSPTPQCRPVSQVDNHLDNIESAIEASKLIEETDVLIAQSYALLKTCEAQEAQIKAENLINETLLISPKKNGNISPCFI